MVVLFGQLVSATKLLIWIFQLRTRSLNRNRNKFSEMDFVSEATANAFEFTFMCIEHVQMARRNMRLRLFWTEYRRTQ